MIARDLTHFIINSLQD
ncbi:TPA: two-component system connector SafA [Escherichia coli]|nr:two-component system connector SafA [Escherichia coli]